MIQALHTSLKLAQKFPYADNGIPILFRNNHHHRRAKSSSSGGEDPRCNPPSPSSSTTQTLCRIPLARSCSTKSTLSDSSIEVDLDVRAQKIHKR